MKYWDPRLTNLVGYYLVGVVATAWYGWRINIILAPVIILMFIVIKVYYDGQEEAEN